jgi:threonylcarbamoyladenosine tRNA methylthiotransferase MtaB
VKTFSINTLGCKVNQYESQQIRQFLENLGLNHLETPEKKPDLAVVNTCCVTLSASAKSRQYIRRAQRLNPGAVIVVCGCLPIIQISNLNHTSENVHFLTDRENIATTLNKIVNGKTTGPDCKDLQTCRKKLIKSENNSEIKSKTKSTNQFELTQLTSFKGQTRAFLKIQDGCDGYCSYCIIPKTRPFVNSKPAEMVIQEAQQLVEAGHKEIVVTGIFLGAYGQKTVRRKKWASGQNDKLPKLLEKLTQIPNLARIRLSSLEPADVTDRLLDVFCRYRNIMPHLHLSLQSGSDRILKRMGRQYSADEFRDKIELIKSRLDRPAITADFIVGFPGETQADFQQTVDLARQAGFAKMHVFCFSAREGTTAAAMQNPIAPKVIKMRSKILRDLGTDLARQFREQFIGGTATILTENSNGQAGGRSEMYFMVWLDKTDRNHENNELLKVKLVKNNENEVLGTCEND